MTTIEIKKDNLLKNKLGLFVHHHSPSNNQIINNENYKEYIEKAISLVEELGITNIEIPFTHILDYDNEFVEAIQYLTTVALNSNITVMIVANGNLNALSDADIKNDSNLYLSVIKKFAETNSGMGIIYNGINEAENGSWYGKKNYSGLVDVTNWNNELFNNIKSVDSTAITIAGGPTEPKYLERLLKNQNVSGDFFSIHPYLMGIGEKGSSTPESQLLHYQYTFSNSGKSYVAGEFGISSETSDNGIENNWQGMVSPEQAGAYLVRQIVIQDYLGVPLQYLFMLGYYYDFKKFAFFDTNGVITPVGASIKRLILELGDYKFNRWVYCDYSDKNIYVAEYLSNNSEKKYIYWANCQESFDYQINGVTLNFSFVPEYVSDVLIDNKKSLIIRTPYGLKSLLDDDVEKGEINKVYQNRSNDFVTNDFYVGLNDNGDLYAMNSLFYKRIKKTGSIVSAKSISGYFNSFKLRSKNGTVWEKTIDDNGKLIFTKLITI